MKGQFKQLGKIPESRKAYAGAALAMLSAVAGIYADSDIGKIAAILAAGVTALLGVYTIKNADSATPPVGPETPL